MIKKYYQKELKMAVPSLSVQSKGSDVKKVQEWLNLWRSYDQRWNIIVDIDGIFGHQTETVVKEFQKLQGLPVTGVVDVATFNKLVQFLSNAFQPISGSNLRTLIIEYAEQHLRNKPLELKNNHGPWVRAYVDGNEGSDWPWCMGFAQTIIDQACSVLNQSFTQIMPHAYGCDSVGQHGLEKNKLLRNKEIRKNPSLIEPGDLFLIVKTPHDWTHTGIVISVVDDWIHTIEGNTNDEGAREGYEVCKRMRNFMQSNIDIFKVL
ncbi:peptidoglycan-binding protein [Parabacteroides sp. FAFU027]|uniref:peptidoglycan-binding protein n=1 Tax=Parabacteroides sp. FAFU027 TaxID=2922715 RepID=UPI001FAFEECA|nr:peptidoglycan-binding protein [Parabacteroides sp. FAFU027]